MMGYSVTMMGFLEPTVSILRDLAVIFVAYKSLQALNVYIKKNS